VIAFQSFDSNIRYKESFVKCKDIDNSGTPAETPAETPAGQ
jgi:hypothetical protein